MLQDTFNRIDALKATLEDLRPLKAEDEHRLWQKLRLEWNYNSNHIEGNTLTYGETMLLLIHGQTNGGHTMREFEEMKAHDAAVAMVKQWADDPSRNLTEADVRTLNQVLLKEPFWKEAVTADGKPSQIQVIPGKYKTLPNNVRLPNGEVFLFASVEETPALMAELMGWFGASTALHPVEQAARFHHRFVAIHPFGDGNGRTARLVVNYILMRAGLMPLVIKSADKRNYLRVLQQADAGDMDPFIEYLAQREAEALELGIKAAQGESIEEPSDVDKDIELFKRSTQAKSGPKQSGSLQLQIEIFNDSLNELIHGFEEGLHSFRELFRDTVAHLTVGNDEHRKLQVPFVEVLEQCFNEFSRNLALMHRANETAQNIRGKPSPRIAGLISPIELRIDLLNYLRAGTNVFNVTARLNMTFDQFAYKLESPGTEMQPIELLYHQRISQEQSTQLINHIKKSTLQQIRIKAAAHH